MRGFGILLLAAGLIGMGLAFLFPVAVSPDVVAAHDVLMAGTTLPSLDNIANMDLIAVRSMLNTSAGFVAVCGAILTAMGTRESAAGPVAAGDAGSTIGL